MAAVLLSRKHTTPGQPTQEVDAAEMPRPPSSSAENNPTMGEEATTGTAQPRGEAPTTGTAATRADKSVDQRTALAFAGKARNRAEQELDERAREEKLLRETIQKEENDKAHEKYLRAKEESDKAHDKYRKEKAQAAVDAEEAAKRSREAARARAAEPRHQADRPPGGKGRGRARCGQRTKE